jgi:hypothetical protein
LRSSWRRAEAKGALAWTTGMSVRWGSMEKTLSREVVLFMVEAWEKLGK